MDNKNLVSHIEWAVLLFTILGMHYSINSRIDADNARFDQFMIEWKNESKDFHGRLCQIEERIKDR